MNRYGPRGSQRVHHVEQSVEIVVHEQDPCPPADHLGGESDAERAGGGGHHGHPSLHGGDRCSRGLRRAGRDVSGSGPRRAGPRVVPGDDERLADRRPVGVALVRRGRQLVGFPFHPVHRPPAPPLDR